VRSLALDPTTGDLLLTAGRLTLVEGATELPIELAGNFARQRGNTANFALWVLCRLEVSRASEGAALLSLWTSTGLAPPRAAHSWPRLPARRTSHGRLPSGCGSE